MEKPLRITYETPSDFSVNEDAMNIMEFQEKISDHTFWIAKCRLAEQLNTDVGTLETIVWGQILHQLGLWDPKNPRDLPTKVHVTLRDLQDSPKALEFGPNKIFQANMLRDEAPPQKDVDPFDDYDDR